MDRSKNKDNLTPEEQEELLQDLLMLEVALLGYERYVSSIGKKDDAKKFVKDFMEKFNKDDFDKELAKKEAERLN